MRFIIFAAILAAFIGFGFLGVAVGDGTEPAFKMFLMGAVYIPFALAMFGFIAFLVLGTMWWIACEIDQKVRKPKSTGHEIIDSLKDFRDKMKRGDIIPMIRMERCCHDRFCSRCHGEGFIRTETYLNDWQETDDHA